MAVVDNIERSQKIKIDDISTDEEDTATPETDKKQRTIRG